MSVDQKSYLFTENGIARAETLTELDYSVATANGLYAKASVVGSAQINTWKIVLASGRKLVLAERQHVQIFGRDGLTTTDACLVEPGQYLSVRNSFVYSFGTYQRIAALNGLGDQELNTNIAWLAGFALGCLFEGKTYSSMFCRQRSVLEEFMNRFRQSAGSGALVTIDQAQPYQHSSDPDLSKIVGYSANWRSHREQIQALVKQDVLDAIALSPFEVKAAFLSGLFDCCYQSGVFNFERSSEGAPVEWLQHLLLSLGIDSILQADTGVIVRWYSREKLIDIVSCPSSLYSFAEWSDSTAASEEEESKHTVPVNAIGNLYSAAVGQLPKFVHEWATFSQEDGQVKWQELHPELPHYEWLKNHFLDEVVSVEEVNIGIMTPEILSVIRVENNVGLIVNGVALG